jgi:hypothetical protein
MAASADLIVNIVTKMAGDGMDKAQKSTSKFKSGLSSASKVAGVALLAVGAAAIKAADAAAQDQKGQDLLANSMKNAAGATASQIASTEDWIDAQSRATGVTDDELRPALGTLVRATGDVTKSQAALKTAMDISAATGKPLASITDAMAKGFGGNTAALSRLVPGISQAALKSKNFARIMKEVGDKTKGSAAAAADSAAGKMERFKNSLGETQEAAGAALLPVMDKLSGVLMTVGQWAQDHGTLFTVIAAGVAVMAVSIIALNAALTVYNTITAVTAVVSKAAWLSTLGPILLVVAAVVLVVAIIVVLWKKCAWFRNAVTAIWNGIKTVVIAVWSGIQTASVAAMNRIKALWNGLKGIVKAVVNVVKAIWKGLWTAASAYVRAYVTVAKVVFNALRAAVGFVVAKVQTLIAHIKDIRVPTTIKAAFDRIKSAADNVKNAIGNVVNAARNIHIPGAVESALHGIKTAADNVVTAIQSVINWIKNIPTPHINWPSPPKWLNKVMPGMAPAPGVPTAATFASPGVSALRGAGATTRAAGGGITINVTGALDPESTARQVARILAGHDRRIGLRVS